MLKMAGLVLVVVGCTAAGIAAGNELGRRVRELQETLRMLGMLEGEIGYANAVLPEGFRHTAARVRQPFSDFLRNMAEDMEAFRGESLQEIFRKHIDTDLADTALNKKDKDEMIHFSAELGYLDTNMQLAAIAGYRKQLAQECIQAQEEYRKNSKVFRHLGLMGGLFLAVIFF